MNKYIKNQIDNMLQMSEVFIQSCIFAAKQDDGIISKEEEKQLRKLEKATKRFQKEIAKVR